VPPPRHAADEPAGDEPVHVDQLAPTVSHATTSDGYAYDEASSTNPLTTGYGGPSSGNAFTGSTDPFAAAPAAR